MNESLAVHTHEHNDIQTLESHIAENYARLVESRELKDEYHEWFYESGMNNWLGELHKALGGVAVESLEWSA